MDQPDYTQTKKSLFIALMSFCIPEIREINHQFLHNIILIKELFNLIFPKTSPCLDMQLLPQKVSSISLSYMSTSIPKIKKINLLAKNPAV